MKTAFLIIFSCLGLHHAIARQWSYDQHKLAGKYIAEVYAITGIGDKADTTLLQVISFNERLKMVEETDEAGLQSKKVYNPDGTVQSITNYSYGDKTVNIKKTEFQYKNGLKVADTDYELIKDKWQKTEARLTKYKFNKNGQVIQSTYSNENGEVYHNAFMTYDTKLKPKQLFYYDDYDNLMLPACIEKKVVMQNTVHHYDLYQYDNDANIVRYSMAYQDKKPSYKYHYRYDDKGKLIAYDYFNGNNFDKRCVFEYLPNGLIASVKTYSDEAQTQVREFLLYRYP